MESSFFDFDKYIQKKSQGHIIYANRNIGKSTYFLRIGGNIKSILQRYNEYHPDNIIWTPDKKGNLNVTGIKKGKNGKFVYMRTVNNQTNMSVIMLKQLLPNCKIDGKSRVIFKPFYEVTDTKKENPIWEECGCILDLSTSYKTCKSYAFNGYDFVFWDEINEINTRVKQLWFKLIAVMKTVQRNIETFEFVALGNKDTTNDELINVFGVRPNSNPTKTIITTKQDSGTTLYIIGGEDFKGLNQSRLLANKLASLDDTTNDYLNLGHFGYDYTDKILNYNEFVKPTFNPIFKFIDRVSIYYFGSFENTERNNELCYYIVKESRSVRFEGLTYISFNNLGSSMEMGSLILDQDTLDQFGKLFFYAFKRGELFLNDFDTYEELIPIFTRINLSK